MRSPSDPRVFEFFGFISLDDGELPLELIFKSIDNSSNDQTSYKRTYCYEASEVVYKNNATQSDYKQSELGTTDYADRLLDSYISVIEIANPTHSLWSDGRWNKLTMARGCYMGKCASYDISLDYIKGYEPLTAKLLVDRMVEISTSTPFNRGDEVIPTQLYKVT